MLPTELKVLSLAGMLLVFLIAWLGAEARRDLGAGSASPTALLARQGLRPLTARLARALDDLRLSLLLYTIAAVIVTLGDRDDPATRFLAWLWLLARLLHLAAAAFDRHAATLRVFSITALVAALGMILWAGF